MSAATADDRSDQRGGIPMRLHGLDLSYFTGKVHACLRAKGLEHEFIEMDTRDFRRCAAQTGVAQMPQLELPDGRWLTDSSAIVEHFEQACPEPTLYPTQGALCFIAHLLAACRALDVGATGVHSDAVQGASTKLGRAPSEAAQHRDAPNSPPAQRVGAKRGVCVVAPLGHGPAMAGAPRLAPIPVWLQRVPRPKPDRLLKDFADEWLWRPAMYYRWAFDEDASLASGRLARGLLRDVPVPVALRRLYIRARQRRLFLRGDGVTPATAPVLQAVYHDTLDALQGALGTRPFLLGQRPSQADLGFFGPMFRHFSTDPTPARLLRERAPAAAQWLARMWQQQPAAFEQAPEPQTLAAGLGPLLVMVCDDYLPTLASQEGGLKQGARQVNWVCRGVTFTVPVNPYQVHCLQQLRRRYQALKDAHRQQANAWLMTCGAARAQAALDLLAQPGSGQTIDRPGSPHDAARRRRPLDRQWSPT